ncbi:MAG: acyl-ACP--UDP-N-acetylglucosamine O-acyltransferase [Pseudolabrys sp.]|nr:acyl-ACP--UDP-N-acetylglucosamine O-acyltransferase [Pseudolabrys sp.]MBV9955309.1 acyl-ACP--UDP-N-acetylglucosamine O-acyltransferase [Pseudolabrys sp.]
MTMVDPTARIEKGAAIGKNVSIGPYCVIGPNVMLGDNCRLSSHVVISGRTSVGPGTTIASFASLGAAPQSVHYKGEDTALEIGADCKIFESVTVSLGTSGGHGVTRVGSNCMLMNGAHVGHDCVVGNNVVFASNATLGGFCVIGDHVFLGGLCAVHQFSRIGEQAMIGGLVGVTSDIIPFALVIGHRGQLAGLNRVGLRRRGIAAADITKLYEAYQALFFGPGAFKERVEKVAAENAGRPLVMRVIDFIRTGKRKLAHPRSSAVEEE